MLKGTTNTKVLISRVEPKWKITAALSAVSPKKDAAPYPRQKATIKWHKPTCKSIQSSAVLPLTRETAGIWMNEKCVYILSNRAPGHTRHRASKARK